MVGGLGSVATPWHTQREGHLALDVAPDAMWLVSFTGKALPLERAGQRPLVPVNATRTTPVCPSLPPETLRAALAAAEACLR